MDDHKVQDMIISESTSHNKKKDKKINIIDYGDSGDNARKLLFRNPNSNGAFNKLYIYIIYI